jgi:hypothetical protein
MSISDKDNIRAAEECRYRDLWVAVVLQAKDDIENEPLESNDFAQAVAFFIGSGSWVQNRTAIADYLDLHSDDLEKMGRRCINARRLAEGLEPLLARQPWPTRARTSMPVQEPQPQQPVAPPPPSPTPLRQVARRQVNPFFPRGIFAPRDRAA